MYFDCKADKPTQIHKHLGMMLDSNLSYEHHTKAILNKVNKAIGLLRKFQLILPRHSLISIYKTYIRPHLYYGDVIYDRAFNESFHQRLGCCNSNNRGIIGEAFLRTRVENVGLENYIYFIKYFIVNHLVTFSI